MSEEKTRQEAMLRAFEGAQEEEGFSPPGYEICSELAQGGMAVVYLARQLQPEREVALKMVLPKFADDEEICERFQREGKAMAALDHPGVLPVYQVDEWDGMAFLVMKLARGGSLQERLAKGVPEVSDAVDWLINAGEAVHFAHQRGVLHRDLKPDNLLFDNAGTIYVSDFGVAKLEFATDGGLTRTEAIVGTPNYLAPEVAKGTSKRGNVTADLYGLGAVLYECLTGKRPHDGADNLAAQLRAVVDEEIESVRKTRPDVPRDLEVICMKALAKEPEDRFGSVAGFVEDLRRWRDGREILSRPAGVCEKIWRWVRTHRLPAALLVILFMVLVAAVVEKWDNIRRESELFHKQSELLHESLVERARAERLVRRPGFRQRALNLLKEAREIQNSNRIQEEAVVLLAHWDVGGGFKEWEEMVNDSPIAFKEEEEGLRVEGEDWNWFLPGGVLRCDPALSPNGRFLAVVRGERMEVIIYDIERRLEFSRVVARDWPEQLVFEERGERFAIEFSDGTAALVNVRGEVLLDGFEKNQEVLDPVGFRIWEGQYTSPQEVSPYGGKLSSDEKLLATTSATGVQLWDVEGGKALSFYEAENQRIDASTDVWWIEPRKLLLQVPGALEILTLNDDGRVLDMEEVERVPGAKVMDIRKNGDWVMEVRTEDRSFSNELWPGGNFEEAQELEGELPKPMEGDSSISKLSLGEGDLLLPYGGQVRQVIRLKGEARVIAIMANSRVCDWDLDTLERELEELGF